MAGSSPATRSAVAFGSVSVVSTIFVVTISTSIRRVLDLGANQLSTDQRIADQIVSSSYGQQLAAFRYLQAPNEATRKAIEAGADPTTVQVVDVEEVPLSYLPSNAARIRVKVVGDLVAR